MQIQAVDLRPAKTEWDGVLKVLMNRQQSFKINVQCARFPIPIILCFSNTRLLLF